MVALLISLKIRLLRGSLRGSVSQQIGLAVSALAGLGAVVTGAVGVIGLRFADPDVAASGIVAGGSLLVLGWAVVPLLVSGVDETLDPARFALLPLRARQLVPGLLVAGLVGIPGMATTIVAAATVVTWSRTAGSTVLAVLGAILGVMTCVLASRLLTTAAARLLSTRRFREVGGGIAVLLLSSIGLWPLLLSRGAVSWESAESVVSVLGWTPLGLPWAAPADAASGHLWRGILRLALALAVAALTARAWAALLDRALADQATSGGSTRARVGTSLLDRLPVGPVWAVTARSLRYWRRDPRYLVAFTAVLAASTMPMIATRSTGGSSLALGFGPFLGVLLGITTANDVGYDGSAFAAHLLVGVPGPADRLGRALAALTVGLPLVVSASIGGVLLAGRGELWPAALGAGVGALLGGVGTSALASALVPYPVPEAGSNPFRGTSGGGARAGLGQGAVLGASFALALPAVALLVVGAVWWLPAVWLGLVTGPAVGAAALWIGVLTGGHVMDARGPEILASVRKST